MITLIISIAVLVLGYLFYGKLVEKVFRPNSEFKTPAYTKTDGIDYLPMPTWKVFMIQLLNIAGTVAIHARLGRVDHGCRGYPYHLIALLQTEFILIAACGQNQCGSRNR